MNTHGSGDRATAPWFPTHLGTRARRLVVHDSPAHASNNATIAAYQQMGRLVDVGPWTTYEKDRTCPGNPAVLKAIRKGRPLPQA